MAAFFTPAQVAHLSASEVRCDLLVRFDFKSQTMFAWNGSTKLEVGGNTYLPMHGAGLIDGLGQAGQGTASEAITMTVSGIPEQENDILAVALSETDEVTQQMVTVSLQLFDKDWQAVGTPIPLFRGFMQPPAVSRTQMEGTEGATQSISITAENVFYGRSRAPNGRYTDADQQSRKPGDTFFGFVSSLVYKRIVYPDF